MIRTLKPSIIILAIFTLLLGVVYPCFMWGIGHLFFHKNVEGSLLYSSDGKILGSTLIGQNFQKSSYFHPRPSHAHFDAANSSASNLGPTSQKLIDRLTQRTIEYRKINGLSDTASIPSDAVTESASGLDPHISPQNAKLQAHRIADARNIPLETLYQIIDDHTEEKILGIFGEQRINVTLLNRALDQGH